MDTSETAGRWGLTLPLGGVPLPAHRDLVQALPGYGYTDVWSMEVAGTDAFTPLALVSTWAPGLRLGTAIVPVFTRGPGLVAMSAATLAELAPGRFSLGIGASSPAIVRRWNDVDYAEPYRRTRDMLRFLRRALAGEKVSERYATFAVDGFRLERPPESPPPISLAALRPGMLRLAGREADGVILNWLSAADVRTAVAELGDVPTDFDVSARIFVCPTTDTDHVRRVGARMIAGYLTVPAYAAFHDWLGRAEALAPMHRAWAEGRRAEAVAAVPDEVIDALLVHGSVDECREHIRRYAASGVTTPIMALVPGPEVDSAASLVALIRDLGPKAPVMP